jgi:hypothetical protein
VDGYKYLFDESQTIQFVMDHMMAGKGQIGSTTDRGNGGLQ